MRLDPQLIHNADLGGEERPPGHHVAQVCVESDELTTPRACDNRNVRDLAPRCSLESNPELPDVSHLPLLRVSRDNPRLAQLVIGHSEPRVGDRNTIDDPVVRAEADVDTGRPCAQCVVEELEKCRGDGVAPTPEVLEHPLHRWRCIQFPSLAVESIDKLIARLLRVISGVHCVVYGDLHAHPPIRFHTRARIPTS